MLRGVMASHAAVATPFGGASPELAAAGAAGVAGVAGGAGVANVAGGAAQVAGGAQALPPPNYEEKVAAAKNITGHDPARVAQVVKQWVSAGE